MAFTEHMDRLPPPARRGVEELAASGDVAFVLLFGSRARGTHGPLSDVDLAVLTTGRLDDLRAWQLRALPGLSGPGCEVDLVLLDDAPPALRFRVARDGLPLWVGDPAALHRFRVQGARDWLDFEPMLRCHARTLRQRLGTLAPAATGPTHG